jgi:hypothetical protein
VIARHVAHNRATSKAASGSFALWYLLAAASRSANRNGRVRHCGRQGTVSGGLGLLLLGGLWLYVYIAYLEYFMIFLACAAAIAAIPLLALGGCKRIWPGNHGRSGQCRSALEMAKGAVSVLAIVAGAGVAGGKLYADTRRINPVHLQAAQASYRRRATAHPPVQPAVQPSSAGSPPENARALTGAPPLILHGPGNIKAAKTPGEAGGKHAQASEVQRSGRLQQHHGRLQHHD